MMQDFSRIRAVGEYVIAKCVGTEREMRGGLIAPDTAASDIWEVISVGPLHKSGIKEGDRVGFTTGTQLLNHGTKYVVLAPPQILFALPLPTEAEAKDDGPLVKLVSGGVLQ